MKTTWKTLHKRHRLPCLSLFSLLACTTNNTIYEENAASSGDAATDASSARNDSGAQFATDAPALVNDAAAPYADSGGAPVEAGNPYPSCPSDRSGICDSVDANPCPGLDPRPDINANGVPDCVENLLADGQFAKDLGPWIPAASNYTLSFSPVDDFGSPASGSAFVGYDTVDDAAVPGSVAYMLSECVPLAAQASYSIYFRMLMSSVPPAGIGVSPVLYFNVYSDANCASQVSTTVGQPVQTWNPGAWSTYSSAIAPPQAGQSMRFLVGFVQSNTTKVFRAYVDNVLLVKM